MTRPPETKTVEVEIEEIKTKKERAIKNQDFEGAAQMRDKLGDFRVSPKEPIGLLFGHCAQANERILSERPPRSKSLAENRVNQLRKFDRIS